MPNLFNAMLAEVEIYLDDGNGAIDGAAIMTLSFRRATAVAADVQGENISHAGSPTNEFVPGTTSYTLELEHLVQGRSVDLRLSDALYYIRVINRSDGYQVWDRYNLKKCRRIRWDLGHGEQGPVGNGAAFVFEDYNAEAVQ